jgi:hypothetical protein
MNGEPRSSEHTDVGAYALGLLEPRDRQAFEEHLAGCPACAAELAELSGMKSLLSDLGPVAAPDEPAEADVADLVRRRAESQRRHARRRVLLGAAAAVVLLAGGTAVGVAVASQPAVQGPEQVQLTGAIHSATSPVTGVHGTVGLVKKPFGTQVTLDLAKISGPKECRMVAVSKAGKRFVIATWFLPPVEFGAPAHPAHLRLVGWTTIKTGDLSRIDVTLVSGGTLVSIPVAA